MAVVAGVLLDHVAHDPAQAWHPAVGPCTPGRRVQTARGQGFGHEEARALDGVLPASAEVVGWSSAAE